MINVYIERIKNIGYIVLLTEDGKFIRIIFNGQVVFQNCLLINKPNKLMRDFLYLFYNYLEGEKVDFDFPFYIETTSFKKKVYSQLKTVKYGNLISYKELACRAYNPNAFRAVGTACKMNPLPLIIPCHRVIKSNGELGGYTGGLELKRTFINIERRGVNNGI
jgi:methylated-DNA-[protein]-cysteine S-methyltransferase